MDLPRLKSLIDLVAGSQIAELEIVEGDERVRIVNRCRAEPDVSATPAPAPAARPTGQASPLAVPDPAPLVTAPMYGILHLAPAPGGKPFVAVGDQVDKGTKLCLIEAMKVFNAVVADRPGRISEILAADSQEVDVGQPLFRIA